MGHAGPSLPDPRLSWSALWLECSQLSTNQGAGSVLIPVPSLAPTPAPTSDPTPAPTPTPAPPPGVVASSALDWTLDLATYPMTIMIGGGGVAAAIVGKWAAQAGPRSHSLVIAIISPMYRLVMI